jgi:hypothetical protein
MAPRVLPAEVISLVNHLELNRAGWWDDALERLVLAAIWHIGGAPDQRQIRRFLRDTLDLELNRGRVEERLQALVDRDELLEISRGHFKIPEQKLNELMRLRAASDSVDALAQQAFVQLVAQYCPSLDPGSRVD